MSLTLFSTLKIVEVNNTIKLFWLINKYNNTLKPLLLPRRPVDSGANFANRRKSVFGLKSNKK